MEAHVDRTFFVHHPWQWLGKVAWSWTRNTNSKQQRNLALHEGLAAWIVEYWKDIVEKVGMLLTTY